MEFRKAFWVISGYFGFEFPEAASADIHGHYLNFWLISQSFSRSLRAEWETEPTSQMFHTEISTSSTRCTSTGEAIPAEEASTRSTRNGESITKLYWRVKFIWIVPVRFPGELHMVHYNSKYRSLEEAKAEKDGLAVLAVFIQVELDWLPDDFPIWILGNLNPGEPLRQYRAAANHRSVQERQQTSNPLPTVAPDLAVLFAAGRHVAILSILRIVNDSQVWRGSHVDCLSNANQPVRISGMSPH